MTCGQKYLKVRIGIVYGNKLRKLTNWKGILDMGYSGKFENILAAPQGTKQQSFVLSKLVILIFCFIAPKALGDLSPATLH